MSATIAQAPRRARPALYWLLLLAVPAFGVCTLLTLRAIARQPQASSSDLEERLRHVEEQLAALSGQPRLTTLRLVPDPTRHAASLDQTARTSEAEGRETPSPSAAELAMSQDPKTRRKAAKKLRDLAKSDPEAQRQLRRLLGDPDASVRREALDALRKGGDPTALNETLALLGDSDRNVREGAAKAAASLAAKSTDATDKAKASQALQAALKDKSFEVQAEAIEALGRGGDPSAIAPLREVYGDGSGPNALGTALALAKLGDRAAFQKEATRLRGLFDHGGSSDEKRDAIRVLAEHAPQESRAVIEKALRDPSDRVRKEAQRALERSGR